ncbi:hypothetical protein QBC39DRAFT_433882, partial [Podospora conica]
MSDHGPSGGCRVLVVTTATDSSGHHLRPNTAEEAEASETERYGAEGACGAGPWESNRRRQQGRGPVARQRHAETAIVVWCRVVLVPTSAAVRIPASLTARPDHHRPASDRLASPYDRLRVLDAGAGLEPDALVEASPANGSPGREYGLFAWVPPTGSALSVKGAIGWTSSLGVGLWAARTEPLGRVITLLGVMEERSMPLVPATTHRLPAEPPCCQGPTSTPT